jgi:hypothetical protein
MFSSQGFNYNFLMNGSPKFSLLRRLAQEADFADCIPKFFEIENLDPQILETSTFILRSALNGESGRRLNSGKSESIARITSRAGYESALERVRAQPGLFEIALQEYKPFEAHYTAAITPEMIFVEPTFESNQGILFLTETTEVGQIKFQKEVAELLRKLQKRFRVGSLVVELGVSPEKTYLFQVNLVDKEFSESLFNNHIFKLISDYQKRWNSNPGIFALLKSEYRAWKFRKRFESKKVEFNIASAFENWSSILHYYTLFCLLKRKAANPQTWCEYLSAISRGGFQNARKHLLIANAIAENSSSFLPSSFLEQNESPLFLGEGTITGIVGVDFVPVERLLPQNVYSEGKGKVFLTLDSHVLSHGFLSAAETGTAVVGNLPKSMWARLSNGSKVRVDFNRQEIQVI